VKPFVNKGHSIIVSPEGAKWTAPNEFYFAPADTGLHPVLLSAALSGLVVHNYDGNAVVGLLADRVR
jgi:hypothetical protein